MEKRKANILLELSNIIVQYPNTKEYIEQKLHEKCKREGASIDIVILFFLASFRRRNIFTLVYHTTSLS